jgi:hypothetical protein
VTAEGSTLRQVTLDERSLPYLDRVLGAGGDLSHVVLERLHAAPLHAWTLLPADLDAESAYSFADGIVSASPTGSRVPRIEPPGAVLDALLGKVDQHLQSGPGAICLLEHIWGSPADRWIKPFDFVTQRKGVLVFLTPQTIPRPGDEPTLKRIVRTSTIYYLCVLLRDPEWPTWLLHGRSVSVARLRQITRSHFTAVTRAYDDEGYIYLEFE